MQIKEDEKGNDGIVGRQKKEENGIVLSHLLKSSPPVAESQTNSHVHIGFIVLLLMFSKPEFFLMRCYRYCFFSNLCLASLKIKVLLFVFDDMLLLLFIFMFGELEDKSPLLCFRGYFTLIVYSYTCSTSLKTLSLTLNCFITFVPCLDIVITIQKQQYNKMK